MHGSEGPSSSGILESRREIARPIDRALERPGRLSKFSFVGDAEKVATGDSLKLGFVEGRRTICLEEMRGKSAFARLGW